MIKNVIFDLGNVLLDIDMERTWQAFRDLLGNKFDKTYQKSKENNLHIRIETGKISEADFFDFFQSAVTPTLSIEQVEHAWNQVLMDFPRHRLDILEELSKKYKVYLLSNTNAIHIRYVKKMLLEKHGVKNFEGYFTKAWYSHDIGYHKPDPAIYHHVLNEGGLLARETVFIDDNKDNITSAINVGIQGIWHPHEQMDIKDLLVREGLI